MTCFSTSSGGSYQGLAILSDSVGGWKQHNVSQGGNFTDSPVNRTLMPPEAEDFDPLGGHTIWQVTISCFYQNRSTFFRSFFVSISYSADLVTL